MRGAKNSEVAWALAFGIAAAAWFQGEDTLAPVILASAALICGAIER